LHNDEWEDRVMTALFRRTRVSLSKRLYLSAVELAYPMGMGLLVRLLHHKRGRSKVAPMRRNSAGKQILLSRGPLVSLLLIFIVTAVGCNQDPNVRKQKYYKSGLAYIKQGKLSEATIQFRNALQIDPQYADAETMLGKADIELKLYPEAYKQLKAAVDANADNLPARNSLGSLYILARRFPDAQAQAEYILQQSPKDVDARLLLAVSLAGQQKLSESEHEFRNLLELSPGNLPALTNLAILKIKGNQPDAAESFLKEAVERNPSVTQPYLTLANFYVRTGRAAEAEQIFRKALTVTHDDVEVLQAQALYYENLGKWDDAEKVVRRIQALHFSEQKYWGALADYYVSRGDWPKAKAELERVVSEHKKDAVNQRKLVETYVEMGNASAAEKLNESILRANPKDVLAHLAKGRLYLSKGDTDNAIVEFNKTKQYEPDLPALYFWYAQANLKRNEVQEAKQALSDAIKYDPNFRLARLMLGELLLRSGAPDAALSQAQEMIARQPRDTQAVMMMADAYMLKNDYGQAEKILKAMTNELPQYAVPHEGLGVMDMVNNDFSGAQRQFEQAWNLQPNSEAILSQVVQTYVQQKQLAGATKFLEGELGSPIPNKLIVNNQLARIYELQGRHTEAIALWNKVLAENPGANGTATALATAYVQGGKSEEAIQVLDKAVAHNPRDPKLQLFLGNLLEQTGDWKDAQKAYEQALQLDSSDPMAQNNLAWLMTEHGGNIDVALKLAQQAKEKATNDVNVTDTIGWIYYKKASYQVALAYLRDCAKKSPGNPTIQYHLGMTYLHLGAKEEARAALQKSIKLDPHFQEAESAHQALSSL
jgi:tetratricopeptide (TPR) repeat protein